VPSHPKYGKALRPLVEGMYVSGVDFDEILVVLNDCGEDQNILKNYDVMSGVRYVTIKNNIYEYGAHVGIMKAVRDMLVPRTNDFVVLHDTCLAGKNFKRKCLELQESSNAQIVWATTQGNFNLGIYRYEAVEYMDNLLRETMKMDKHFAIEMEHNVNHMSPKRIKVDQHFDKCDANENLLGKFNIYGDSKRDIAYLPCLDLYKIFLWVPHGSVHPNMISG